MAHILSEVATRIPAGSVRRSATRNERSWYRLKSTTYAVGSKPDVHLDERPDSPAAAWYAFFLFTKKLTLWIFL
jgi:hypothetical protein